MTDPYILQAREMLAAEAEERGDMGLAKAYRHAVYDCVVSMAVVARVLREHDEKQPTFEQRVEAIKLTVFYNRTPEEIAAQIDRRLAEIMAPKVDPLVETLEKVRFSPTIRSVEEVASDLRKALAARGLEIREVQG